MSDLEKMENGGESKTEYDATDVTETVEASQLQETADEVKTAEVSQPEETVDEVKTAEVSQREETADEVETLEVSQLEETADEAETAEVSQPEETADEAETAEVSQPEETADEVETVEASQPEEAADEAETVETSQPQQTADMQDRTGWDPYGEDPARRYMPLDPPERSGNKAMVIALVIMFVLLAGLCIYVGKILSNGLEGLRAKRDVEYESDSDDPWADILGEDKMPQDEAPQDEAPQKPSDREDGNSGEDGVPSDEKNTYFDRADFTDNSWKECYENHDASEFQGPYYEDTVDCIDESVPYQIKREFDEYLDEKYNICIRTSYVQLEGDIPNLEAINEQLKNVATEDIEYYKENKAQYQQVIENYDAGVRSDVKSFVTYNDAETVSVAVHYESNFCYDVSLTIKSVNINLVTGTIMDNTQILDMGDSFGEEFRQRSNKQNGSSQGIELFSNIEIVSMLNQEDSLIIFYTPIGMEVGYAYRKDGYVGWITISMKDYEKYRKGL